MDDYPPPHAFISTGVRCTTCGRTSQAVCHAAWKNEQASYRREK